MSVEQKRSHYQERSYGFQTLSLTNCKLHKSNVTALCFPYNDVVRCFTTIVAYDALGKSTS